MLTKRGLLFVSISLFLFATFLMSPALSAELPPIKLGVNLPFSGFYAEEGKLAYEGAMLAIEDANAKGGIKGRKITFIHLDDATDPARAVTNAKRLIELEKVPVIIGSCSTAMTLGLLKVAEPAKVPIFASLVAGAAAYEHRYFFSQPNDRPSMEAAVSKIAADGHKNFVHLYLNNPWGIGNIELVNEFASKKGLRVLSHTAVEPESTDLTVLVTRVMATKPDAVLPNVPGKGASVLARAFEAVGWHPPNYQNGLFPTIAVKILGGWELFEGVKMFRQYDTRNPLCSQVFEKYQKRNGVFKEDLNILGGWDAAQAAIEAIRAAKDPKSGESIQEAAERLVDVPAATGRAGTRIKYAPDRHYILGADSFAWVQIKGGKPEYAD